MASSAPGGIPGVGGPAVGAPAAGVVAPAVGAPGAGVGGPAVPAPGAGVGGPAVAGPALAPAGSALPAVVQGVVQGPQVPAALLVPLARLPPISPIIALGAPNPSAYPYRASDYSYYAHYNDYVIGTLNAQFRRYVGHLWDNRQRIVLEIQNLMNLDGFIITMKQNNAGDGMYINLKYRPPGGGPQRQMGHFSFHLTLVAPPAGQREPLAGHFHTINETVGPVGRHPTKRYILSVATGRFKLEDVVLRNPVRPLQDPWVVYFDTVVINVISMYELAPHLALGGGGKANDDLENVYLYKKISITIEQKDELPPIEITAEVNIKTKTYQLYFDKKEISENAVLKFALPFIQMSDTITDYSFLVNDLSSTTTGNTNNSNNKNKTSTNKNKTLKNEEPLPPLVGKVNLNAPDPLKGGKKKRKTRKHRSHKKLKKR